MGRKSNHIKRYENVGKPTKMTPEVIAKLEDAFTHCFSDKEACLYAGIHPATLYRFQEKYPGYSERKELLRLTPNMAAKKELVTGIKGNLDQARWWASNKMTDDFGPKATPAIQVNTQVNIESMNLGTEVKEAVVVFEETMRKVLTTKQKQPA